MNTRTENTVSGGAHFGGLIQAGEVHLSLPYRPDPALAGLPRHSSAFAGRHAELERVLAALAPGTAPEATASAVAVTGLAGSGKTELLLQAAHRAVREEGWFPGGVLFVDLHGYDDERKVSPKRALGTLLRALGVPAEAVPSGTADRALVYRSALGALADAGRRVLVVLDDVPATDKLHHLLPSDGRTATLVSARHSLAELDAQMLTLRELTVSEGRDLLATTLHTALPDDARVAAEPGEADRIVRLCDGLPLALRILTSLLVDVPARPLSHLRQEIEGTRSRLSVLSREDRAVATAFDLSYRRLTPDQARLFRLTALNPGPDFSTEAAARLYGAGTRETGRLLEDLARRHLVESRASYGRWQQHGLVRDHAWQLLRAGDDDTWPKGLMRLLAYFHEAATLASTLVLQPTAPPPAEQKRKPLFADRDEALRWLEAERPTLVAAALWSHQSEDDFMCVSLAIPVARFLLEMHYTDDAAQVLVAGIGSSRRNGDRRREASLLSSFGIVLRDMRKLRKSARVHRRAIKLCRREGRPLPLASALNNFGLTLHDQRAFDRALAAHSQAARIFRRTGDRHSFAQALANAGETLIELGRPEEAVATLRKASKIFRKLGDLRNRSHVLDTLARATRNTGAVEHTVELHRRALALADGVLLPHERAVSLTNLASALTEYGDLEAALTAQQEALAVFRQMKDRRNEAMTLGNMAQTRQRQRQWSKAVRLHTLALEAFLDSQDDHGMATELVALSEALLELGRNIEALENLELAAGLYAATGDANSAADARSRLGLARVSIGLPADRDQR
ncbi:MULTISPECIES: tetratricopeptide repeat protein [unclassified Streptomyces]|uniref:tetratricopeptide repeat protein n=1 Tax=unclassified Streptomyces TaxID=2593676 RepID=UPI002E3218E3|nr:tetratricopeptide repeat protein [Streptomyces sp. NBC_01268]